MDEARQKAVTRAHGVGNGYAIAVVGEQFAVAKIQCAMLAQRNADLARVRMLGDEADVLLYAAVGRAQCGGDFMQFVVVELDEIGLPHHIAQVGKPVVRRAQVHVKNFEGCVRQQFGEGLA